ncbi:MAG TPA: rhodanese-like domain-containing protein [Clostridiales bacterium]|nr:rhodanese-like domain-containing protein [Clostridiales bacterium]
MELCLKPTDIIKYINRNDVLIIDLREKEYYDSGHIPNSINMPIEFFDIDDIKFNSYNLIILYCERGNISLLLSRDMLKKGYNAKSLYGGLNFYKGLLTND